jgi:hypothetical protein
MCVYYIAGHLLASFAINKRALKVHAGTTIKQYYGPHVTVVLELLHLGDNVRIRRYWHSEVLHFSMPEYLVENPHGADTVWVACGEN